MSELRINNIVNYIVFQLFMVVDSVVFLNCMGGKLL